MLHPVGCRVLTLALLLLTFHDAIAVKSRHLSDVGKVRQVVSVLQGISKKLASERETESVIYDEIKRYCGDADSASENESPAPESGAQSDNEQQDPQDADGTVPVTQQPEKSAKPSPLKAAMIIWGSRKEDVSPPDVTPADASDLSDDTFAPADESDESNEAIPLADTKENRQRKQAALAARTYVRDLSDSKDLSAGLDQMNAALDAAEGSSTEDAAAAKVESATKPALKVDAKAAPTPLEVEDASVGQLQDIVKAAVEPSSEAAQPKVSAAVQPDTNLATVEPLASDILSVDGVAEPQADAKPQKVAWQNLPERPQKSDLDKVLGKVDPLDIIPVNVDKLKSMQSEFDDAAKDVASLETDMPDKEAAAELKAQQDAAVAAKADAALVAKAVAKAEQQANGETNAADLVDAFMGSPMGSPTQSASFADLPNSLGGAIPSIDQQAMQLYNSFGGAAASGDNSIAPASFLQVSKHQLSPAMRADLDAAYDALKEVTEDSNSAMSMMDLLRNADDADEASIDGQCTSMLQKFEHRQAARSKHQADLEKRSQRLLASLQVRPDQKAKHLRSPHSM